MTAVDRRTVVQALNILGIDPSMTDEVVITTNSIIVRRREVITIASDVAEEAPLRDPSEAHSHA